MIGCSLIRAVYLIMKQAITLALKIGLLWQTARDIIKVHFLPLSCMFNYFGEVKVPWKQVIGSNLQKLQRETCKYSALEINVVDIIFWFWIAWTSGVSNSQSYFCNGVRMGHTSLIMTILLDHSTETTKMSWYRLKYCSVVVNSSSLIVLFSEWVIVA